MATTVVLQYGVWFGKCDASDWIEWEVDVTGEAEEAYLRAKMLRLPLDEIPELESVLDDAREEIAETEIENMIDYDDEYVRECTGRHPVDPDEINELVRKRDPHTLQFFGLEDKSDEELDDWDANDEDELPYVCDFDESFKPSSPFDGGYRLTVEFAEHPDEEELEEEEARETLTALFQRANGDYSEVEEYLDRCDWIFQGDEFSDIYELASDIARSLHLNDYEDGGEDESEIDE